MAIGDRLVFLKQTLLYPHKLWQLLCGNSWNGILWLLSTYSRVCFRRFDKL